MAEPPQVILDIHRVVHDALPLAVCEGSTLLTVNVLPADPLRPADEHQTIEIRANTWGNLTSYDGPPDVLLAELRRNGCRPPHGSLKDIWAFGMSYRGTHAWPGPRATVVCHDGIVQSWHRGRFLPPHHRPRDAVERHLAALLRAFHLADPQMETINAEKTRSQ